MSILGATYKDKITGFKGIATGHCRYLTGCHQTLLAPKKADQESKWFDDQRLEPVGDKVIKLDNSKTPGFDKPAPIR